jgi:hypothetical protein
MLALGTVGLGTAGLGTAGLGTAGLGTAGLDTVGLDTVGLDTAGLDTVASGAVTPGSDGVIRLDARPGRCRTPAGVSRGPRLVAHPANGHHDLGAFGIDLDLRPKPLHVHVDQSGVSCVPVAPNLFE